MSHVVQDKALKGRGSRSGVDLLALALGWMVGGRLNLKLTIWLQLKQSLAYSEVPLGHTCIVSAVGLTSS